MSTKQNQLAMIGLLAFSVIIFIATSVVGLSILSSKSNKMVSLKLQSKTEEDQLTSLAAAKKQIQKYSYFNEVANSVIPNDKDQAQAVIDIFQMASASGITLQNIIFPASTLGAKAVATGATGSTPSSISPLSQAKPVSGIPGLYSLQITINPITGPDIPAAQAVTYAKFLDFLNRIEHDRRTAQITQVNIQPQTQGNSLNFSLAINIFIKP